ncbi:MAG: VWA domain-containing protein [Pyrinomonadaceae bacterium]
MLRLLFIIGLVASALLATPAQQVSSVRDELHYLNVAVTTDHGEWISGLKRENFSLFAGKSRLTIEKFSSIAQPVSVGILVDKSGSTESFSFPSIAESLRIYAAKADPQNDYFILAFDKSQTFLLRPGHDAPALADAIKQVGTLKGAGETDVAAAVKSGLTTLASAHWPRRTLLLISDMLDGELSAKKVKELREILRRTNTTAFGIVIRSVQDHASSIGMYGLTALEDLASESGGRVYHPQTNREMNEILYRIAEDLGYQYSIGFKPEAGSAKKGGEWQKLDVKVELPPGLKTKGKLVLRHRRGYYAGS